MVLIIQVLLYSLFSRGQSVIEKVINGVFTVQCTDVWNKVCKNVRYPASKTFLCHKYNTFSLANISDIAIFVSLCLYWHWPQKFDTGQAQVVPTWYNYEGLKLETNARVILMSLPISVFIVPQRCILSNQANPTISNCHKDNLGLLETLRSFGIFAQLST